MSHQPGLRITDLHIYPVKGEPGIALDRAEITGNGLSGDRPKKSAVHIVTTTDLDQSGPRANIVVEGAAEQLEALVGKRLHVGEAELVVTGAPSNCPGVYADVARVGTVRVGDVIQDVSGDDVSGDDVSGDPQMPR